MISFGLFSSSDEEDLEPERIQRKKLRDASNPMMLRDKA